jgi:hypothetical protein
MLLPFSPIAALICAPIPVDAQSGHPVPMNAATVLIGIVHQYGWVDNAA